MLFGIAFGVYTGMGFIIVLSRFYHFSTAIRFVISIPPWPVRGDLGVYGACIVYDVRARPLWRKGNGVNLQGLKKFACAANTRARYSVLIIL